MNYKLKFRSSVPRLCVATLLGLVVSLVQGQASGSGAGSSSQGISGLIVDANLLPINSPGTISVRIPGPSDKGMPDTSDVVTFGPTESYLPLSNSALQRPYANGRYEIDSLAPGDYEVGMQVPDGYQVFYSMGPAEMETSSLVYKPYGPIALAPVIVTVHLRAGQHVQLNWKFVGAPRVAAQAQPVAGERPDPDDVSPGNIAPVSQVLSCNIDGTKGPLRGTDFAAFDGGTSVWSKIGVNHDIGGIGVSWTLINHADRDASVQIIDATSAGGAAWQSTLGLINKVVISDGTIQYPINHFNQAAGNSAEVWGFRSPFKAETLAGLRQLQFAPLFSNDLLASVGASSIMGADNMQSPCYHTGTRFGEGRISFRPTYSDVYLEGVHEQVLHINSTYRFRALSDQHWVTAGSASYDEQALYMLRSVAFANDLRIYVHVPGQNVAGPVRPADDFAETVLPASAILHYRCNDQDPTFACFFDTQPIDYAVLVWKVGNSDVAVAIHGENVVEGNVATTFTGVINLRRALNTCTEQTDHRCGNVQWHSFFDLPVDANGNGLLRDGRTIRQKIVYDVGTLPELSKLGFRIDNND